MKKFNTAISILLLMTVLSTTLIPSAYAQSNHEQMYQTAISLLADLEDTANIADAEELFSQLGTYKQSKYYLQYIKAIRLLYDGQPDDALSIISVLSILPDLEEELTKLGLPGCVQLTVYAQARQAEASGNNDEAQALYVEAPILDAIDRLVAMNSRTAPTPAPTMEPQSTDAADVEEFTAPVLKAENAKSGVMLNWSSAGKGAVYQIYWKRTRNTNDPFVLITDVKETSFAHINAPLDGIKYSYYIKAVLNGQEISSNIVDIVYRKTNNSQNGGTNKDPAPVWEDTPGSSDWDPGFNLNTPNPSYDDVVLPVWE